MTVIAFLEDKFQKKLLECTIPFAISPIFHERRIDLEVIISVKVNMRISKNLEIF